MGLVDIMTTILAIKTKANSEYEGFIEHVIKSSFNVVQNRIYLHQDQNLTKQSECIIILQIADKQIAEYMKMELEQITDTSIKIIHFE